MRTEQSRLEKKVKEEQLRGEERTVAKAKELTDLCKEKDRKIESIAAEKEFLRQELQQMRSTLLKAQETKEPTPRPVGAKDHGDMTPLGTNPLGTSNQKRKRKENTMATGIDE